MKGLKVVLWICGIAFLLSFIFLLIPWRVMVHWCELIGIELPLIAPVSVYVTRLLLVCSGLIGIFFLILAANPLRYGPMLPLAGYGLILAGLVCLAYGIRYKLHVIMFGGDVVFSIVAGLLILVFRARAIGEQAPKTE
jgi:hypothetical protein